MKKLKYAAAVAAIVLCALFSACSAGTSGSLKELTHPYIATYECTRAEWGGQDFLDGFDYIRIVLSDEKNMELKYKKQDEAERSYKCEYSYNEKTGEFATGTGALGIKFREKIVLENGKFTISLPLLGKQLVMQFES